MMTKKPALPPFYQSCKYFVCDELKDLKPEDTCYIDDSYTCTNSYCIRKNRRIDKCESDCTYYTSIYKEYCKNKCKHYNKNMNKCMRRFNKI